MIVSVNWLSAMLDAEIDPIEASEQLAMLGEPVESIEPVHQDLRDIVVGEVEHVERHPDADRLWLCKVNNGADVVEVVCGAPVVNAGSRYPYAAVGVVLPGGIKLKGRKIRGIKSHGMLCSASELQLGTDADGIMELDTDVPAGTPLLEALAVGDYQLDVEVTPNRPDLLCHRGIARDLGAAWGKVVKLPPIPGAPVQTNGPVTVTGPGTVGGVEVSIEDTAGCPRYMAAVIRGVTVGPSPAWLARRLTSIGQRPINNVVDATNYILFELNQPMHAFDLAKLTGGRIIVRRARPGERLVTLDGEERDLDAEMTAICDAEDAVAVGGVMGGASSEVGAETSDVVLECAYFDPKRIRATRTALKMSTEASYRFERGTDLQGMADAIRRAVALIIAVAGGEEDGPPADVYPKPVKAPSVFLRPARVAHLLGVEVPVATIERHLTRLGFSVAPKDDRLAVQVPGWRPDVSREADLIEEIARLEGYDSFPTEMVPLRPSSVPDDPEVTRDRALRIAMSGLGLHEARSFSLGPQRHDRAQALLNPFSAEEGFLRTDLMAGLVEAVEHNWAVRERDIRLFEIGITFRTLGPGKTPAEDRWIGGVVTGARVPAHWSSSGKSVDFDQWDVKSLFEEAVRVARVEGTVEPLESRWVLRKGDEECGWAGEVEADRPPWGAPVFGFELRLDGGGHGYRQVEPLPSTPAAIRDVALVLPAGVSAAQVDEVIAKRGGALLESAAIFDEFRGKDVAGRSVAWRLTFRAADRTLRDDEVEAKLKKIIERLEDQLGVKWREA